MEKLAILRLFSAILYALSSFLIVVINKIVLTTFKFPSFQCLAIGQMITTVLVLGFARGFRLINFSLDAKEMLIKIFPLPLIYLGNIMTGLGGTKKLSLPMFTVLRRFSILFTMILEYIILKVRPSNWIQLSVFSMILGAIIAASDDLAFDIIGYIFIFGNDVFTALNGVIVKKKLENKEIGKYGLIFYNSFFVIPFALIYAFLDQEHVKNMIVTYSGMMIGGDYIFSWPNFVGLNISILGSLFYSYLTFFQKLNKEKIIDYTLIKKNIADA
ncbi:solute carrier family 35 member D2-like protein isoform X1 [Gordionus sp. m RMFG-2023]|uniref:solute carrier family 35 member D2-like protein isoform X1 n=1 Tax=Gordionus sp. m RMFG-2023 TaxID=3053472 RepID=UPI0031FDA9AE